MYTRLEPLLMQLDYSMKAEADALHHKHDKRKRQGKNAPPAGDEPLAETESESEAELAGFSPVVDVKKTALALAITDSELSDEEASILESGGFSVSRATTPQLTDVSEGMSCLLPLLIFLIVSCCWLCPLSSKTASSNIDSLILPYSPRDLSSTLHPHALLCLVCLVFYSF